MLPEPLLCVRHCFESCDSHFLTSTPEQLYEGVLLGSSFNRWGNGDQTQVSYLPKVRQPVSLELRLEPRPAPSGAHVLPVDARLLSIQ